jgi:hypothetical protein
MSKKSFYCWYLGFTEAYGPHGNHRVYEVIHNILKYYYHVDKSFSFKTSTQNLDQQRSATAAVSASNSNLTFNDFNNLNIQFNSLINPSKVTICLNENCLNIIDTSQIVSQHNNARKLSKKPSMSASHYLSPEILNKSSSSITYDNVTYVCRLANKPYADIVTFIVKTAPKSPFEFTAGHQPPKLHLHAFRCDSEESAAKLEECLITLRKNFMKKIEKQREKFLRKHQSSKKEQLGKHHANINDTVMSVNDCTHLYNNKLKNSSFLKRQIFKVFSSNQSNVPPLVNLQDEDYLRQLYYNVDKNSSGGEFTNNSSSSQNDLVTSESSTSNINEVTCNATTTVGGVCSEHVGTIPYCLQTASNHLVKVHPVHSQDNSAVSSSSALTSSNNDSNSSASSSSSVSPPLPPAPPTTYVKRIELFENITREMSEKFRSGQPILYPPKDYAEHRSTEKVSPPPPPPPPHQQEQQQQRKQSKMIDPSKRMSSASQILNERDVMAKRSGRANKEFVSIRRLENSAM